MDSHFHQKKYMTYRTQQKVQHTMPFLQSNGLIKQSIKTINDALTKSNFNKHNLHNVLYHLRSKLIGPHMPSPWEILHNRTDKRPAQPSAPMDIEDVQNFFTEKKQNQRNTMFKGTELRPYQYYSPVNTSTSSAQKDPVTITFLVPSYAQPPTPQLYSWTQRPLIPLNQTSYMYHQLLWTHPSCKTITNTKLQGRTC